MLPFLPLDLMGMLGEDQAHGTGTKGEFVNTAQRGLRDAVIRGVAESEGRTPVEMGRGGGGVAADVGRGRGDDGRGHNGSYGAHGSDAA